MLKDFPSPRLRLLLVVPFERLVLRRVSDIASALGSPVSRAMEHAIGSVATGISKFISAGSRLCQQVSSTVSTTSSRAHYYSEVDSIRQRTRTDRLAPA
jgi:hypothetical protein